MLSPGAAPVASRSSGTKAIPAFERRARVAGPHRLAADADRALRRRAQPGDRLGELALAVARRRRRRRRSRRRAPTSDTPRTASSPRSPATQTSSSSSIGPAGAGRGSRAPSPSSRPTISAASDRGVDSAVDDGRDGLAAAQHGDAVGDRRHLVQLVRDEDHRPAVVGHLPQRPEQHLGLLRREHRGRLVEDQDAGVAVERLQDLDPLLLAERELPDPRPRVDREPVALARARARADSIAARIDPERASLRRAVLAERDVLGDGERLRRAGSAGAPSRSRRRARRAASRTRPARRRGGSRPRPGGRGR